MTITTITTVSKAIEKAVEKLHEKKRITYGFVITKEIMEELFEEEYSPDNNQWAFRRMQLQQALNNDFFMCTTKGIEDPGFRILEKKEMAQKGKATIERNLISNFRVNTILASTDISDLTPNEQKEHNYVRDKVARVCMAQSNAILEAQVL